MTPLKLFYSLMIAYLGILAIVGCFAGEWDRPFIVLVVYFAAGGLRLLMYMTEFHLARQRPFTVFLQLMLAMLLLFLTFCSLYESEISAEQVGLLLIMIVVAVELGHSLLVSRGNM